MREGREEGEEARLAAERAEHEKRERIRGGKEGREGEEARLAAERAEHEKRERIR